MLQELKIRNLAVVEDAVIEFADGLNVLTGSTGAGKSIILTAVELLSGSRARKSMLRRGAESLAVEGVFAVPAGWLMREKLGMGPDDELLSIKREFTDKGKSRIWINGTSTTVSTAHEAAMSLLELHGQHRQQELLDPSTHILYLDSRGGYGDLLSKCMERIELYKRLTERLRRLQEEMEENRRQEEYLRFQFRELVDLDLEPGLDVELERRINKQAHVHRFITGLEETRGLLGEEEGSVLEKLSGVEKALVPLSEIDEKWGRILSELKGVTVSIQEMIREVDRSLSEIQEEPEDLELLQERLASLQRAGRKYRLDCAGLIARRNELEGVLQTLEQGSDELMETGKELESAGKELLPLLENLSERRKRSARDLDGEVTRELHRLGMKGALFKTLVERLEDSSLECGGMVLSPRGRDRVEFRIRTNVGEDIHPLADVASGGELSRITLVLKKLQVEERRVPALIFDEIDSGLGADLGGVVAQRLSELAARYQIICITHIPQVAALAKQHILVRKRVKGGRTVTSAVALSGDRRKEELARMLGGKGRLREELAAELLKDRKSARSSAG